MKTMYLIHFDIFKNYRWNVSDFSSCSKTCGGGIQTRSVTCIQEVRHGGNNILRVDDSFCPQPPPITQQFCSVVDCPVKWKTGPWSKVRHGNLISLAVSERAKVTRTVRFDIFLKKIGWKSMGNRKLYYVMSSTSQMIH